MPDSEQLRKALDQLVHDLRTPLGVALGYLRLLRDDRLTSTEDRQRAMSQSVEALGLMSRLCQDASTFAERTAAARQDLKIISAVQLTAEVAEHLAPPVALTDIDAKLSGSVRASGDGATARAVAALLSRYAAGGPTPSPDIIVRVADAHLSFLTGAPEQCEAMLRGKRQLFDPWRAGPGLAVPLAVLEVSQVSGRVFTDGPASAAVAVMLPLETSA